MNNIQQQKQYAAEIICIIVKNLIPIISVNKNTSHASSFTIFYMLSVILFACILLSWMMVRPSLTLM